MTICVGGSKHGQDIACKYLDLEVPIPNGFSFEFQTERHQFQTERYQLTALAFRPMPRVNMRIREVYIVSGLAASQALSEYLNTVYGPGL